MGFGFGFGFDGFSILFTIMFVLVFGMILFTVIKSIAQWGKNNASPRLTVDAVVITKRISTTSSMHNTGSAGMHHHHTSTTYYVTFQVESGDRMELCVSGQEYGMLAKGDCGRLTFQGTRYLGFARNA